MNTAEHRATLDAAITKFNAGDLDGYVETLYAPDAVLHYLPPGMPEGHAGAKLYYGGFQAGFPDLQVTMVEAFGEGDRLAGRFVVEGTHLAVFNGIPATGKRVHFTGTTIVRFENGRVVERWSESDVLGMLQQIGVNPAAG